MADDAQYVLLAVLLEQVAPEARIDACRRLVEAFIARNKPYRCYEIHDDPTGFWGPGPREPAFTKLPDDFWELGKISLPSSVLTFAGRKFLIEVFVDEPTSETQQPLSETASPARSADTQSEAATALVESKEPVSETSSAASVGATPAPFDGAAGEPDTNNTAGRAYPGDSLAEARVRAELTKMMREDPENKERRSKQDLRTQSGISGHAFDRIWANCITDNNTPAYKKSGPRGAMIHVKHK